MQESKVVTSETKLSETESVDKKLVKPVGDTKAKRDRDHARELFKVLSENEPGTSKHDAARDELIRMHIPLVEYLARRFKNRGESLEDLTQVATIGLIKSVDRFDATRDIEFSTYATPTIIGEIKRHFRDKGWIIRVPRRLQELKMNLTKAATQLNQDLGRSPTVKELAAKLDVSEEEVIEGLEASRAYSAVSLDNNNNNSEDESNAVSIADSLGFTDPSLNNIELRASLKPLLAKLTQRERDVLGLRFIVGRTQSQIATDLNVSQMHVSRLLAKALAVLREGLEEEDTQD